MEKINIKFSEQEVKCAVRIEQPDELTMALKTLGLDVPRPTLVLVGGAARMSAEIRFALHEMFAKGIAPMAEKRRMYVVDGATDSGVMQLMGTARAEIQGTFPLVGVAAIGTVAFPDQTKPLEATWELEPHHSHFVFVPGSHWGNEAPWIARTATALAGSFPSATVLVNGGDVAWMDLEESVRAKRHVLVVAGTGRTADVVAAGVRGQVPNARANALASSGLLQVIDLPQGIFEIVRAIGKIFSTKE